MNLYSYFVTFFNLYRFFYFMNLKLLDGLAVPGVISKSDSPDKRRLVRPGGAEPPTFRSVV